ncbi:MAG: ATP-binding protein [Flavitalea sp.]
MDSSHVFSGAESSESDTSASRRLQAILAGQKEALELVLRGADLSQILERIATTAGQGSIGNPKASILLVSPDGKHLHHGAAPGLPDDYNRQVHGIEIGPDQGSCGSAAFTRKEIVVRDIETHPAWQNYKHVAISNGLRACWSIPVFSSSRQLLGTFALYYPAPQEPTSEDRAMVGLLSGTTGIVIEWVRNQQQAKQSESALKASERRFQNLVRDATVAIAVTVGPDHVVSIVNDAYGKLIGRTASEIINKPLFSIIPETESTFRPIYESVMQSGQPIYLYDQVYTVNSGHDTIEGYLNLVYQAYREPDGTISGVMTLGQDVTEQVLSRKKVGEIQGDIERQKRTYDAIANNTLDLLYVFDPQYRFTYVNEALLRMWGKTWEDSVGKGLRENGYEEWHAQMHEREIDEIMVTKQPIRGEVAFPHAELGRRVYDYILVPVINENGEVESIAGTTRDISELKQAEAMLESKVSQRTAELQIRNEELEQFTHVSHHDLQEPLRKIILFAERIKKDGYESLNHVNKKYFDKIVSSASRMSIALQDVLDFASLSREELFADVDLNAVVENVKSDLELMVTEKNAAITVAKLPVLRAVPQQMHQLFYNLLNNALKFSREAVNTVIEITCRVLDADELPGGLNRDLKYCEIVVIDNGIGFDPLQSEKIFGIFQRLHDRSEYAGTGIGLALSKKVVLNHGGRITAESEPGVGTRFYIILPFS